MLGTSGLVLSQYSKTPRKKKVKKQDVCKAEVFMYVCTFFFILVEMYLYKRTSVFAFTTYIAISLEILSVIFRGLIAKKNDIQFHLSELQLYMKN